MNVSLSSELERFIRKSVSRGRYKSASEVVRDALRLLQEAEKERSAREITQKQRRREAQQEFLRPLFDDTNSTAGPIGRSDKRRRRPQ